MREHARNDVIYPRRRVEDYAEPDRPIPKWSDLDHDAVKIVRNEVDRLQQGNVRANETLRKHGLQSNSVTISSSDGEIGVDAETGWRLLLAAGVVCGAFIREIGAVL